MLGAILSTVGVIVGAAAAVDGNDRDREIAQREHEKEIALEKERTKRAIINGVFDIVNSCKTDTK